MTKTPLMGKATGEKSARDAAAELRWAWELHKEADNLLHQRLNGFVAVNAFLAAGYFFATEAAYNGKPAHSFVLGISVAGVFLGPVFLGIIRRLVRGIGHLKQEHLFHDEIYSLYFGKRSKGPFVYWFAYGVPGILTLLWLAALGYSLLPIGPTLAVAAPPSCVVAASACPPPQPLKTSTSLPKSLPTPSK
ncbi:MAG TPA: hypothetical protein PLO65_00680 [Caulobacter sp.]|nr:hypothetical protein [Caulobacter sp.]